MVYVYGVHAHMCGDECVVSVCEEDEGGLCWVSLSVTLNLISLRQYLSLNLQLCWQQEKQKQKQKTLCSLAVSLCSVTVTGMPLAISSFFTLWLGSQFSSVCLYNGCSNIMSIFDFYSYKHRLGLFTF